MCKHPSRHIGVVMLSAQVADVEIMVHVSGSRHASPNPHWKPPLFSLICSQSPRRTDLAVSSLSCQNLKQPQLRRKEQLQKCLSFLPPGSVFQNLLLKSSESRLPWEPLKPGPGQTSRHLNGNGQCRQLFKGISLLSFNSSAHIWARLAAQQRHPTGTPQCSGLED